MTKEELFYQGHSGSLVQGRLPTAESKILRVRQSRVRFGQGSLLPTIFWRLTMPIDRPDKYQVNQTNPCACVSPLDDQAPRSLPPGRKRGRNLGLGTRNLTRAGKTCAHQSGKAFATRGTLAERWWVFANGL